MNSSPRQDSLPPPSDFSMKRTAIGHQGRQFCSPMNRDLLAQACDRIDSLRGVRLLDVGCGKGEALRLLGASFGCRGLGIDLNEELIKQGRRMLRTAGLAKSVELRCQDAAAFECSRGDFGVALCLGSSHALGGWKSTMTTLSSWLGPNAWIIQGELTFAAPPDPAYLVEMGMTEDSCPARADLAGSVEEAGLTLKAQITVPQDVMSDYEMMCLGRWEEFAAANPEDPDAPTLVESALTRRKLHEKWGRSTLGFDVLVMQVPK